MDRTWARVREEVDKGGRAYVVCARIDPSEPPDAMDDVDSETDVAEEAPKVPLAAVTEVVALLAGCAELARGERRPDAWSLERGRQGRGDGSIR